MSYTHLSQRERYQIQALHRAEFSSREIGELMQRDGSTVGRELRRNTSTDGYEARQAHQHSTQRRYAASTLPHIDGATWKAVEAFLVEDLSPEQIAGLAQITISHERIYQHIAADRQRGGTLWTHLRCRKRRRHHRCGTPKLRQRFRGRRIDERPAIVDSRQRVGDWEGDTIVGQGSVRIMTLVERKSGLLRMRRVVSGEARPTLRAIVHALHPLRARVHTLTWDNGSEFAEHALIDIALEAKSYFANPYSSWQRGSNENMNGLLRQYFPKRCDLGAYSEEDIQRIEDKLNRRPRKRLGFRTPQQVFDVSFNRAALRS